MHAPLGIERLLGGAVLNELDPPEEPPAPDIAHVRVVFEVVTKARFKCLPQGFDSGKNPVLVQPLLDRERSGTRRGVADVGMPVLEEAGAAHDGITDLL